MPFLGHLDVNFIALQSLILIYISRSFVSRVAPLPLLKFRLNESNGAHFRCAATDQKLAYGNFPRLLEVHAGSGSGALFSFVVHEIAECTGAHVRSYRNGCFPGFRNSVWIFMSDHLDQAAVDGISVSLPIRPSFSRVDTLLFFSSRRPRNCYSILNMLEFIDNGYLVALFILVSRNCESKLGIGMWTRACKLICVGYR